MMKTRRITFSLALLALLCLSSSSSLFASAQQQGGFDAAAAGDFEPDIAGEPLPPLAPAVIDEEEAEVAAAAPAPAAKKPAAAPARAPAPAPAAAAKKKEEEPKAAPAAPAKTNKKEDSSSSTSLPYADLLYTVLARRATFDPRSKKLTLEGVFPIVAAVKVGNGDGRNPTSLKAEGKDHECSAQVAKTARRSSATRFFGDLFKRNGTWLNSPNALLMGTDSSARAGAELALRLSDVQYRASASTVVFRAELIDPTTVKKGERNSPLRSSGGVVESWAALASSSGGKWLDPKGSKVVLQDVILDVDAPYWRQEYQVKGFTEG